MQQQKPNNQNNPHQPKKQGYIIIPNYFLREYIKVLGVGPAMFYQYLLTYCHKNKNTAWPSLLTSSNDTGITKKTLTKYYRILIQYGLIKKFSKKKLSSDKHTRNIYQLTPLDREKITLHKGNFYHNIGVKITPDLGKKLPPNNTNLNITNTTTKKTKDVVVNFKKIKEKGEEKMQTTHANKNHHSEQAIRERMQDLDFTKSFTEKVLTEYPLKKIKEKLELCAGGRQVRNPHAWLISALKNDYRSEEHKEQASYNSSPRPLMSFPRPLMSFPSSRESSECNSESITENNKNCRGLIHQTHSPYFLLPSEGEGQGEGDKILSTEEARERFKNLREKLKAMKTPYSSP